MGRSAAILAVALLALLPPLLAVISVDVLPTHDGPKNLYAAHVRFHLDEPGLAARFSGGYPPTAFGFALLYGALERMFGWTHAYRVAWALLVVGGAVAFAAMVRAIHPRRWPLAMFGFAAAVQWAVFMGFVNYVGSLGLAMAALAVGMAQRSWSVRRELTVAALLLSACAFHPFGAQVAFATLLLGRAVTVEPGQRIRQLGALALMGAPIAFVSIHTADVLNELHAAGIKRVTEHHLPLAQSLEAFGGCFLSGPLWRAWPLVGLAAVGYVVSAVDFARTRRLPDARGALWLAGIVGAVAAIALPLHGMAWEYLSPRFLPVAVLFGVASLPVERLRGRSLAVVAVVGALFNLASNGWAAHHLRQWRRDWADAYAGLGAPCEPGRTLLPIIAVPEAVSRPATARDLPIPYASPIANLGELYGTDRSAAVPYSFSWIGGVHLIERKKQWRAYAPVRDYGLLFSPGSEPSSRIRPLLHLASAATDYDDVLFFGPPEDIDLLLELGFVADLRKGRTFLGRLEGCELRVRVTGPPGPTVVRVSWLPDGHVVFLASFEQVPSAPVEIPRASCGPNWVGVFSGPSRCAEADSDGLLLVSPDRGRATEVTCALVPSAP